MAAKKKETPAGSDRTFEWPFGKKNYVLFVVAMVIIIAGFIALGQGSITLAPILLVLGYGLVPFAIMAKGKREEREPQAGDSPVE
ncbi:MAG TPA: hypothetical protein VMY05_03070 [Acidobacteriota bacterium]|nr:hypothetical protein [Acidobacteriota bacterium]